MSQHDEQPWQTKTNPKGSVSQQLLDGGFKSIIATDPKTGRTGPLVYDPQSTSSNCYYPAPTWTDFPSAPNNGYTTTGYIVPTMTTNKNLTSALLRGIKNIENPQRNTKNIFLKNSYADINAVLAACKQDLLDEGIILIQGSRPSTVNPQWVEVYTKLIHGDSGESMEETVVMQPKEASPQGFAGLLTYGRRYSLFAALGLAAVDGDDDGNSTSGVTGAATLARPKPKA